MQNGTFVTQWIKCFSYFCYDHILRRTQWVKWVCFYQPWSLITTDQLINDLDDYDIVFDIGDLPYADGFMSKWDQFTSQVEPILWVIPYMLTRYNFFSICVFVSLSLSPYISRFCMPIALEEPITSRVKVEIPSFSLMDSFWTQHPVSFSYAES